MIKILLILLILLPAVYAEELEIHTYKDKYLAGETVQVDLNFNQMPLNEVDLTKIKLIQGNEEVKIAPFMYKIRDKKYFLYFDLPLDLNGQTKLVIGTLLYKEDTLKEKKFEKVFDVENGNLILSVKPGFFYDESNLLLEVKSKLGDALIEIISGENIKH